MISLLIKGGTPVRDGAKIDKYTRFFGMCAVFWGVYVMELKSKGFRSAHYGSP